MVPRKRDDGDRHAAISPAISAEKMGYGLMIGVAITWLLSVIVSISSLFSLSYIRYQTNSIKKNLMPASCQPSEYNDFELIHIDCPIHTTANFKIPKQFEGRILLDQDRDMKSAVFFDMSMEMFQKGKWYDHILGQGSSSGARRHSVSDGSGGITTLRGGGGGTGSASYFPSLDGLGRQFATAVYAGNYLLDPSVLPRLFQNRKPLRVRDNAGGAANFLFSTPFESVRGTPLKITSSNTQAFNNAIYTSADPRNPREGDLRIRFFINSATHISAIGIQAPTQLSSYSSAFMKWIDDNVPQILGHGIIRSIIPFDDKYLNYTGTAGGVGGNGGMVIMREGDYDADQLLSLYERENDAFASIHWYALGLFGVTTSALIWVVLKKCVRVESATASSGPVVMISGVFMTFGATLLLASIPNIILSSTWRLGALQIVAASFALMLAYWSFTRAPDIYNNYSCLGVCDTAGSRRSTGFKYRSPLLQELAEGKHVEVYSKNPQTPLTTTPTTQPLKFDQSTELIVDELKAKTPASHQHNRTYAPV